MHFDFSVCSERSGSNLIAKIMNAHSEICGPFPSHMFRVFAHNYYRYGDLTIDKNWKTFLEDTVYYMANKFADWKSSLTVNELRNTVKDRTLAAVGRASRCAAVAKGPERYNRAPRQAARHQQSTTA